MKPDVNGLYVVTDTLIQSRYSHLDITEAALAGGARTVQLRDKHMGSGDLLDIAQEMAWFCHESGGLCIVNDRVDITKASGAHGVHLGQKDLPPEEARKLLSSDAVIGGTASTLEEANICVQQGVDYIGFGHIFPTRTKTKEYEPRGLKTLTRICAMTDIPVIAIGGINHDNARHVVEAGAAGFAVTSAVCAAENPEQAASSLSALFTGMEW